MSLFKHLFVAGLVAAESIRMPHRKRNLRERRSHRTDSSLVDASTIALDVVAFLGTEVVPLVYVFSSWLDFADYDLPYCSGVVGALLLVPMLWLLWKAHADLGRNWSPTVETTAGQSLVTSGVYRHIRHPIYAAVWLWVIAQALMLPNWVAGLSGIATYLPLYLVRVPKEEEMMLGHFGEEYRSYMRRTGRVIPPFRT